MIKDLTLVELSLRGYDLKTHTPHQFSAYNADQKLEIAITQRAILLSTGMEKQSSIIDDLVPSTATLVVQGFRYSCTAGTISCESFTSSHRTQSSSTPQVSPILPIFLSADSTRPITISKYAKFQICKFLYLNCLIQILLQK